MSAPPIIAEATLPDGLQRGIAAIRASLVPGAAVVAEDGNFVYVSLGTLSRGGAGDAAASDEDASLPEGYVQDHARLYGRVARNFPSAESYGVVTAPFLQRVDGVAIPYQHPAHGSLPPLAAALGRTDLGFWSWSWQGVPARRPEDLVAVVEWARKCVREGVR